MISGSEYIAPLASYNFTLRSARVAVTSSVGRIRLVIILLRAVPASLPLMPRSESRARAVFTSSSDHPKAAAVGPTFTMAAVNSPTSATDASAAWTKLSVIRVASSALMPKVAIAMATVSDACARLRSEAAARSTAARKAPVTSVVPAR